MYYYYSNDSGEFMFQHSVCFKSPGAKWTTLTPPRLSVGHTCLFSYNRWEVVEDNRGPAWDRKSGEFLPVTQPGPMPEGRVKKCPLAAVKKAKAYHIQTACDSMLQALHSAYPREEVNLWPRQEAEARALGSNTPKEGALIKELARARGISIKEMSGRILARADNYAQAAGEILARKKQWLQAVEDAATREEVQAVAVELEEKNNTQK